jgi:hypothetical protein
MNIQIEFSDEDSDKQYLIEVYLGFERYMYGEDADGNRGQAQYEIDWNIESVWDNNQMIKPDLKLKKKIVAFVEDYVMMKGDQLLEQYRR